MTSVLVGCWIAAIIAMAFGYEYLSGAFFVAGMIIGVWQERREQLARNQRDVHRRLLDEIRRHG